MSHSRQGGCKGKQGSLHKGGGGGISSSYDLYSLRCVPSMYSSFDHFP